jgi:TIR domain
MSDDYKYDAAFSFVERDQQLAVQIADRLRDRMSVFVYSERPEVFAGADGMDQHSRIYRDESRVVVVLHRKEWGQTDWTRVEETVIKDRAFQKGFDFLVTVALDGSEKPVWLPKTRIWVDFSRYGINGVASSVEAAVQNVGGAVRAESVADYALRLHRRMALKGKHETWRTSEKGVKDVNEELDSMYTMIGARSAEVNEVTELLRIDFLHEAGRSNCSATCRDCQLVFSWRLKIRNSLHDSGLHVTLFRQVWDRSDRFTSPQRDGAVYQAELDHNEAVGWREAGGEGRFLTSAQLAEFWIKRLLEEAASPEEDDSDSHSVEGFW